MQIPCVLPFIAFHSQLISIENHNYYWQAQGVTVDGNFIPAYVLGWNAACEALPNGEPLPKAEEQGRGEGEWEFIHGFKRGAEEAQRAGQVEDEQPQKEEHDEEE